MNATLARTLTPEPAGQTDAPITGRASFGLSPLPVSSAADAVDDHLDTVRRMAVALSGKLAWMRVNGLYPAELKWAALGVVDVLSDINGVIDARRGG